RVRGGGLPLSGGKADAGHKPQRKRPGAQENISHGGPLLVRSARALSGPPAPCLVSGGRSSGITAGAEVWFRAAGASLPLIPAHSASLRAFTPVFDGLWTRVNALIGCFMPRFSSTAAPPMPVALSTDSRR